jgi:3'-phosphoadenosine 5'-phosphosulfate sulfotransferase (PAPS reductase)/FAD synthetase
MSFRGLEIWPLTSFEKDLINKRVQGLELGQGVFAVYNDRYKRRRVVTLDQPLVEIRMLKDSLLINPLAKGKIDGMKTESLVASNEKRMEMMVESSKYLAECELKRSDGDAIISFSCGKDSVALSHILKDLRLKNVFVDTSIEFPETYRFFKSLKDDGWDIDMVKGEGNFFSYCPNMGFPTPKNRWCCKTQKFAPFQQYLQMHFGDRKVTVFEGTRRWESIHRLGEPAKREHWQISNQISVNPLLDWTAMDVWVYTWKNKLPINQIYNYYDRAGCWLCPFGLVYRILLMEQTHPNFFKFLKSIGAIPRFRNFSVKACTEGKPMKHLVFSDNRLGNEVSRLLSDGRSEVHENGRIVCVPASFSKKKIEMLINKANVNLTLGSVERKPMVISSS